MRILLTGRGSIAQRHARLLRELTPPASVELVVVSSLGSVDAAFGDCKVVADFAAGLALGPDAVIIASVSSRHAAELVACMERGLPVLAEKPLVISRAQLAGVKASAATSSPVLVGCNLRYLPVLRQVRELIAQGSLGRIVRAHLEVGQNLSQWRPARDLSTSYSADEALGGGVVFDLVHEIDMAAWLLGPLTVRGAIGGRLGGLPISADDVHVGLLEREDGAPVVVSLDYVSQQAVRRYVIVGENGTLTCDIIKRELSVSTKGDAGPLAVRDEDFAVADSYRIQVLDWLRLVADPAHRVVSPLADALATAALMLSMKEAAA